VRPRRNFGASPAPLQNFFRGASGGGGRVHRLSLQLHSGRLTKRKQCHSNQLGRMVPPIQSKSKSYYGWMVSNYVLYFSNCYLIP
jgi:hypothetical protein